MKTLNERPRKYNGSVLTIVFDTVIIIIVVVTAYIDRVNRRCTGRIWVYNQVCFCIGEWEKKRFYSTGYTANTLPYRLYTHMSRVAKRNAVTWYTISVLEIASTI